LGLSTYRRHRFGLLISNPCEFLDYGACDRALLNFRPKYFRLLPTELHDPNQLDVPVDDSRGIDKFDRARSENLVNLAVVHMFRDRNPIKHL
jgi:hypothetical protein